MNKQSLMNMIRTAALAAMAAIPGMCCSYSVSVPAIPASGGVFPVYVNTQAGCQWEVVHTAGYFSNYSGWTGYGPGVAYLYAQPDYGAARSSTIGVNETIPPNPSCIGGRSGCGGGVMRVANATAVQY